jgi:hypothetical protein
MKRDRKSNSEIGDNIIMQGEELNAVKKRGDENIMQDFR